MIALLHGLRAYGAVERYVAAVACGLRDRGEEVVLIHLDAAALAPFAELGVQTVRLRPGPAPRLTRDLARVLRRRRPRVAHVVEVWPPALVAARLARVPRVIVTHHTPELPRHDNLAGRLWWKLGWATRPLVIYTSEADRSRDGRRPSRVVPLGIDLERFGGGRPVLEGTVVGNVARLAEQKGHRTLLAAVPAVLERHPDATFAIAGDGELREEIERLAAPHRERVALLGERSDVPDLLASFAVFAYPSRFEGLCLAVIEAQAAGVPVVATPVGGIRETVVDGETGLLVPPDDPQALAGAIIRLLDDRAFAQRLADQAREGAQSYSEERMVHRTLALYDEMR
ncbi:MAG: glycosyltransferase family 4 protein [Actinomycetota bacterium]|nr:glycosyltransferase family 4 protein [Actinomycetota bacterium]